MSFCSHKRQYYAMQHPHLRNSLHVQTSATLARKIGILICLLQLWKLIRSGLLVQGDTGSHRNGSV